MAENELLPCPFCGGTALERGDPNARLARWVNCKDCNADMVGKTLDEAIVKWNRRASGGREGVDAARGRWTGACHHCNANFQTRAELEEHERQDHANPMTALYEAAKEMQADYMTSEGHHPGYVLVPTAAFKKLQAILKKQG